MKIKKLQQKVVLHPMMTFIFLTGLVIVLSGILDLFDASVTYSKLNNVTGNYESTLVTVQSLFNLSGIKYIFSNTVSNFVSFAPLSMLLISLVGLGIMDKSGLLDTMFFVLTKKVKKTTVTFGLVLICILASITGDIAFVLLIPISALLFKYGKRNPIVGVITSFASIGLGYGINVILNSVESSLLDTTLLSAHSITKSYSISSFCFLFVMIVALISAAFIITYITEKIIAPSVGKYETDEEEIITDKDKLTRKEMRGLLFAGIGTVLYLLVFIYNIIPGLPFGGNLLDYSQVRYIDKLFGYDSFFNSGFVFVVTFLFFLTGLLYGIGTKSINNHRDICNFLSHSLDGIGKVIVLLLFASMFISLLKYTNIGTLISALCSNIVRDSNFGGIPLIILVLFISMITTLASPTLITRWPILCGGVVPTMMNAGFSPEFAQFLYTIGSSIIYPLTPAMAYFVIYISYMEKYDKDDMGLLKGVRYIIPYAVAMLGMWLVIILLWYIVGLPLGVSSFVKL